MPAQSTAPHPIPPRVTPPVADPPKAADLTVNKVLAGAGAAATSAVIGSFFGATGTVIGAALGSVLSTLASTLYQRSLDHTRDRIVARIRPADEGGAATVPMLPPVPLEDPETVRLRVEPAVPRRPRPFRIYAVAGVLAFVMALVAVTGLELLKGSTLVTGQPGTSVGKVVSGNGHQQPAPPPAEEKQSPPADTSDPTTSPTTEPTPTPDPSSTPTPKPGDGGGLGGLGDLLPSLTPPTSAQQNPGN